MKSSDKTARQAPAQHQTPTTAARALDAAVAEFAELVIEHSQHPRIRERVAEVIESRTGDRCSNVEGEVIEMIAGESFIFADLRYGTEITLTVGGRGVEIKVKNKRGEITRQLTVEYKDAKINEGP